MANSQGKIFEPESLMRAFVIVSLNKPTNVRRREEGEKEEVVMVAVMGR